MLDHNSFRLFPTILLSLGYQMCTVLPNGHPQLVVCIPETCFVHLQGTQKPSMFTLCLGDILLEKISKYLLL